MYHVSRSLYLLLILACLARHTPCDAQSLSVRPHATFRLPAEVTALAFSTDGQLVAAGDHSGSVRVWRLEDRQQLVAAALQEEVLFADLVRGDSAWVAVSRSGVVRVVPLVQGTAETHARTERSPRVAALDTGNRYLAVVTRGDYIELFDVRTMQRIGIIDARDEVEDAVYVGFDRLGSQLVAISPRGRLAAWNPVTLRPLRQMALAGGELHGSRARIHAASSDASGRVLVVGLEEVALPTGGLQAAVRPGDLERRDLVIAYDWASGIELKRVRYPDGEVAHLAVGPGSDHAAVAGAGTDRATFVDLREGSLGSAVAVDGRLSRLAVSGDGHWLAVGTREGVVSVFALESGGAAATEDGGESLPTLAGRVRVVGPQDPIISPGSAMTLAVLPFEDRGVSEQVAAIVGDVLTTSLANVERLQLVERLRIEALLAEFKLQQEGITEADGLQLGKMLNADYVVLGSIGALGTTYTLSARLLDVQTGGVVSGRQVVCEECRIQDVLDAITLLGSTIAR